MNISYKGACVCGAIGFSFMGAPRFCAECVCESCRKAHGASVVGWVGVRAEQFSIDRGESMLRWYQSSAESQRGFCSACGTRILFRSNKWPDEIHMAMANIETSHSFVSTKVTFFEELPSWSAVSINEKYTGSKESANES